MILSQIYHFFIQASVDPQTQQLLSNLMNILLPILYALGGAGLIFSVAKYGFKIHNDPENKGEYIRHLVWSVGGCVLLLCASAIGNIIFAKLLGLI